MSCTPKVVRRNGGNCVCGDPGQRLRDNEFTVALCRYKACTVLRCTACHGELCSWGPVGCKCSGGLPRRITYRGMRPFGHWDDEKDDFIPAHVAVKPGTKGRKRA